MIRIGMVVFDGFTVLDAMGPYEILSRVPGAKVDLIAHTVQPVIAEHGLPWQPTITFSACPELDVICVPGGPGVTATLGNRDFLNALALVATGAKLVTSVCSGSLLLGAAGLLHGYRATTHWRYLETLRALGALPVAERVVWDRDRVTAAGVSAGIDFALALAARLSDESTARQIQLMIEYDPQPPFNSGSPQSAEKSDLDALLTATSATHAQRTKLIEALKRG
ncbi:MAG: DJ-1/PfpI family protein [Candidatus Eremiobacteraeota bacterium]|nr:DJ-1/PfpI family protein [Candidatus Eremiobacteraeota bacterium]